MKFELHCHSWYSKGGTVPWEGLVPPREIVKVLKRKGFGGLALTDHDTTAGWKDVMSEAKKQGMVFIPGVEISTKSGHMIALGIDKFIKSGLSLEETLDLVHKQGGIAVAPHPFDVREEGLGREFVKADAAEIFNSLNISRMENRVAEREVRKIGMPAVGGSDAHSLEMLGAAVNFINGHDVDSALEEIRKGRVRIERNYIPVPVVVSWARKRMEKSYDDIEKHIKANYSAPKAALSRFMLKRFVNSESRAWDVLGYFAVSVSIAYSFLRLTIGYRT